MGLFQQYISCQTSYDLVFKDRTDLQSNSNPTCTKKPQKTKK
jgi:hypothetical protein